MADSCLVIVYPSFTGYGGAGGLVPGAGLGAGEKPRRPPEQMSVSGVCVCVCVSVSVSGVCCVRVPMSAMGIGFLETYPEMSEAFKGFWDCLLIHMLSWFFIV